MIQYPETQMQKNPVLIQCNECLSYYTPRNGYNGFVGRIGDVIELSNFEVVEANTCAEHRSTPVAGFELARPQEREAAAVTDMTIEKL